MVPAKLQRLLPRHGRVVLLRCLPWAVNLLIEVLVASLRLCSARAVAAAAAAVAAAAVAVAAAAAAAVAAAAVAVPAAAAVAASGLRGVRYWVLRSRRLYG